MIGKHALAIVLLGAASAPLAVACGVSEGGLGGVPVAEAGHDPASDVVVQGDGSPITSDDGPNGVDAAADSPIQSDAPSETTIGDAAGGGDAGALGEAGGGSDGALDGPGVEGGGIDGALDAGGVPESGGPDGANIPDASVDSPGIDGGPDGVASDAPAACDFSGTWGSRLVIDVSWTPQGITGILLAAGSGTITQWLMTTRTMSGNTATESAVVCGIALPDFDGTAIAGGQVYGIRFPNTLFDNAYVPAFDVHGTFSGSGLGSAYNTTAAAVLLGLTLSNPTTTPWPSTITTEVDMDKDGQPGVTANALTGNGYSYPPVDLFETNFADELYLAIRQVTQLSATAADCDHLTGTVSIPTIYNPSSGTSKPAIDSHVIGCWDSTTGMVCNSSQTSFVDNTQPVFTPSGGSSFSSERMPSGSTCAAVRLALP